MALVEHVKRIFSKHRYNDEEFIYTLSFGMTTNHNAVMHGILFGMVPKKEKVGLDALKLGAALAIIRYTDGYKCIEYIPKLLSI